MSKLSFMYILFYSIFIQTNARERIIGGAVARLGQYPWQAAMWTTTLAGEVFCAGSLISDEWILTTATCVNGATFFRIQLGASSLYSGELTRVNETTTSYVQHPDFNAATLENNIAVIQLEEHVEFNDYLKSIEMAENGMSFDDNKVTVSGWGYVTNNEILANNLCFIDINQIENAECKLIYGDQIKDDMVCARGKDYQGICIGDIGGPLVRKSGKFANKPLLVGVASFLSQNGCFNTDPSGFTRIDYFRDWIAQITGI